MIDPFHVVRLAGNALDECRRRVQLATHGHRGRKTDPLYACRGTLQTGADLLTDKQQVRWQPYSPPTPTPRWKPPRRSISAPWPPPGPRPQDRPHPDGRADHHAKAPAFPNPCRKSSPSGGH